MPSVATSVPPIFGAGLVRYALRVPRPQIVLVRAHLEASEGLGLLFAERGSHVTLVAPVSRQRELEEFIESMCIELGAERIEVDEA